MILTRVDRSSCASLFRISFLLIALFPLPGRAAPPAANSVTGWRGDGTGTYTGTNPPTQWNDTKNVMWHTPVGSGFSSPVVAGGHVFVTSESSKIVCVNLKDGAVLWKAALTPDDAPAEFKAKAAESAHATTSCGYAAPTPVCDGANVYVVFGSGLVGCYSIDGTRKWVQYLEPAGETYGHSSSPLLIDGKLIVTVNHPTALDAATGKIAWECLQAEHTYGTPVGMKIDASNVIVTPLGKVVRVSDGRLLAKDIAPDLGGSEYGISPVAGGNVVYLGDRTVTAVELSLAGGNLVVHKQWSANLDVSSYASPVVGNGMLFFVGKDADCFVIDLKSGKTLAETQLTIGHPGVDDPELSMANL